MLGVAIGITGIAIALLLVYAADVAVVESTEEGEGFLPFDSMVRGMGLGLPALILPFIAFGIARKSPSVTLGVMIIITGALILIGGIFVLASMDPVEAAETDRPMGAETGMLVAAGIVHIGLGVFKIRKSM